jgi:hypothetical protein
MQEREIFGHWGSAGGGPTEGRLLVDKSGAMDLQLRGFLREGPRVSGGLSDGSPVTLFGADLLRRNPDRYFFEEYRVGTAVLGLHLDDLKEECLVLATCTLGGLKEVIGVSGLSLEVPGPGKKRFARVEWQGSNPIEVPLANGTLKIVDFGRFQRDSDFKYTLEHVVEARFQAKKPLCLEEVEEAFAVLGALLAFASEARIEVDSLWITRKTANEKEMRGEVLSKHRPTYGEPPNLVEPWLVLGLLADPAEAVAGFYRFSQEQAAAYLILFELQVFFAALNPIDKLLYLARFLEVYHRTRFPGPRDPEAVHAERKTLVKEALGDDHKAWGSQILHHSNEITFKERIASLLGGPAAVALPVIGGTVTDFAKLVGDCRNYWTHYAPELKKKALNDTELDQLDDRILLVVRACVLFDIGISSSEALKVLERDWRWERYAALPLRMPGRQDVAPT